MGPHAGADDGQEARLDHRRQQREAAHRQPERHEHPPEHRHHQRQSDQAEPGELDHGREAEKAPGAGPEKALVVARQEQDQGDREERQAGEKEGALVGRQSPTLLEKEDEVSVERNQQHAQDRIRQQDAADGRDHQEPPGDLEEAQLVLLHPGYFRLRVLSPHLPAQALLVPLPVAGITQPEANQADRHGAETHHQEDPAPGEQEHAAEQRHVQRRGDRARLVEGAVDGDGARAHRGRVAVQEERLVHGVDRPAGRPVNQHHAGQLPAAGDETGEQRGHTPGDPGCFGHQGAARPGLDHRGDGKGGQGQRQALDRNQERDDPSRHAQAAADLRSLDHVRDQLKLVDDHQQAQRYYRVEGETVAAQLGPEAFSCRVTGNAEGGPAGKPVRVLSGLYAFNRRRLLRPFPRVLRAHRRTLNSLNPTYSPTRLPEWSSSTTLTSWWFCSAGSTPARAASTARCSEVRSTTQMRSRSAGSKYSSPRPGGIGSRSRKTAKLPSAGAEKACACQLISSGSLTVE